jgi:predicted enzyme related to lactoylglutathione lyase
MYFEIQADDPLRAIRFYSEVFGWHFEEVKGTPVPYWSISSDGETGGGLLKRPLPKPPVPSGTNAFTCSMFVEDFDASQEKILTHGGTLVLPKFLVPGKCWQGYFLDSEDNIFGIVQIDESALG